MWNIRTLSVKRMAVHLIKSNLVEPTARSVCSTASKSVYQWHIHPKSQAFTTHSTWTFSIISSFVLSLPNVGYEAVDTFHATGFKSVNSNLKAVRRTTSTTS